MSGSPAYVPKNRFGRWMDARLPLARFAHDTLLAYPTPRNLNVWYAFGAILSFLLGFQILTGLVLSMHYTADSQLAFDSVERIMRDVNFGWLFRILHANGASMFFLAVYLHMFRGLYYGSYKAPREMIWILGVLIYGLMMATAFLGYTLPWGQMSFWAATVITNLFSAIPYVGDAVVHWLWGGFGVDNATLQRFFALHYVLPFIIAGAVVLHIWALHVVGNNNPTGLDVKGPQDTVPFHPYYTVKDLLCLTVFCALYAWFAFFAPDALGHPDNYIPADPVLTPADIVPEWYFLPFYAILRSVPDKAYGVLALVMALVTLLFVPWLDWSKIRSARYRPFYEQACMFLVLDVALLGFIGSKPAEAVWHLQYRDLPLVWVGRAATIYYFAHFWLIVPLVGMIEIPRRLPDGIAKPVLGAPATDQ